MALPNALTGVRGTMDTADHISQEKPLAISNKIWAHEPNRNRGLGWNLIHGYSESTDRRVFGHLEDAPYANWVEYTGAAEASQGTTGLEMSSGHGSRLAIGSRIFFPEIQEIIRIDADMSTDTTAGVTRNYGRGVAATSLLQPGMKGLILTPAFQQGFTTGDAYAANMVYKAFAVTEISLPVKVTNIDKAERARGGDPFTRAMFKMWKLAKKQMEAELYFGGLLDTTLSGAPISTSQGLENYLSTNVYTVDTVSRMDIWDIIGEWNHQFPEGGGIHCSNLFRAMISEWALGQMTLDQSVKEYGMNIDQILTPYGRYDLIDVDLLSQEATLAGTVFGIPYGRVGYRPLKFNEDLDISYMGIGRDEVHAHEGEIYGVYGWEFHEEETFMTINGLRYAA